MAKKRRLIANFRSVERCLSEIYDAAMAEGELKVALEAVKATTTAIRTRHGMYEIEELERMVRDAEERNREARARGVAMKRHQDVIDDDEGKLN